MAQIIEEILVIKLSRMIRDGATTEMVTDVDDTLLKEIEVIVQELVSKDVIVEVIREED